VFGRPREVGEGGEIGCEMRYVAVVEDALRVLVWDKFYQPERGMYPALVIFVDCSQNEADR
jgi:hypothetical protein